MCATVSITDAVANAVRIPATDLRKGDSVFDPMGRTYPLRAVWRQGSRVLARREDYDEWPETISLAATDTITVLRGA